MELFDKAKKLAEEHEEKIDGGIDKAAAAAKKRAGKHAGKIDAAAEKAKSALDKLTGGS